MRDLDAYLVDMPFDEDSGRVWSRSQPREGVARQIPVDLVSKRFGMVAPHRGDLAFISRRARSFDQFLEEGPRFGYHAIDSPPGPR